MRDYFENQCWYEPEPNVSSQDASNEISSWAMEKVALHQRMRKNYDNSTSWEDWWIEYGDGDFYAAAGDDEEDGELATFDDFVPEAGEDCSIDIRDREVTSIVGPYITFRFDEKRVCGDGVSRQTHWKVVELPKYPDDDDKPAEIDFQEIAVDNFGKGELVESLTPRHKLRKAANNDGVYDCVDIKTSIKQSPGFLFVEAGSSGDPARIRLGLTVHTDEDGCEGESTTVEFEGSPGERLAEWLEAAEEAETTWHHLKDR